MEDLSVRVVKFLIGLGIVVGLVWLLHASGAPRWVQGLFDALLVGAFGGSNLRHRDADDRSHPFSSSEPPERG